MSEAPKKLLILAILEILRKYTDEEHRLLQADIIALLEADYALTATRKSVRANLADLQGAGYPVEYRNGWYYEHEFCPAELDLIADSLLCNTNIPYAQCRALAEKVGRLGGEHYSPQYASRADKPVNAQFLYTMDVLHGAIREGTQAVFRYGDYDADKRLHPRLDEMGAPKEYRVSPYRVVFANGRWYLICNVAPHDALTHFRLDHIMEIRPAAERARAVQTIPGCENGLDPAVYLSEHPHMFTGEVRSFRIEADRALINEILDWFGTNVAFTHVTQQKVEVSIRSDELSLYYWLKMYGDHAWRI